MMPDCETCPGACCRAPLRPPLANGEVERIEAFLGPQGGWLDHRLIALDSGGACPLLLDGGCSIYSDRPRACVTFEVGSEACEAARQRAGVVDSE